MSLSFSRRARASTLVLALPLGACATVIDGTNQNIGLVTTPTGASCTLTREGIVLAQISPTPGQVEVSKSKDDIIVACEKSGHQKAEVRVVSSFGGTTFGNILLGGVVGVVVDAASGANHKYPDSVTVILPPAATAPAADAKPAVPTS
jgi:hypothetical protein